jgi:chromosome segregation ATPase
VNQRKIDDLETKLKSKIDAQKDQKKKVPFKNVDELDAKINSLQGQVDTGTMKLVDEKKALAEISNLHRIKKSFGNFAEADKVITDLKQQIADIKKTREDPEVKALSDRYTAIQRELDALKADQDELFKNRKGLFDEMGKARDEQQEKWANLKQIKDAYFQANRSYKDYEREAARHRAEKRRQERDAYEAGKRKEIAKRKLEEASQPAYQDEILTAEGLIRYFDPSSVEARQSSSPGKFAAVAQRTVDAGESFKGMKVVSKKEDEDNYFVGGGGKKKKGKKASQVDGNPAPSSSVSESKFNLPLGVLEELSRIGVETPMGQVDVPEVVKKIKDKLENWKKDQDRKTKEVRNSI